MKKNNKFPKGYYIINKGSEKITLQFDKNGGLCEVSPRVGDILNTYRGRTREFIPEIRKIIYDELS